LFEGLISSLGTKRNGDARKKYNSRGDKEAVFDMGSLKAPRKDEF